MVYSFLCDMKISINGIRIIAIKYIFKYILIVFSSIVGGVRVLGSPSKTFSLIF